MRLIRRIAAALATAAAFAAGARFVADRRRHTGKVDHALRHPRLHLTLSVTNALGVKAGRRMLAQLVEPVRPGVDLREEVVPAADEHPGVRVLVYETAQRARPSGALVWIHGGGFIMGTPEQGNDLCSRFAAELGILVVSVDYRLAPEHPFPAGLHDCLAALEWVLARADELGIDPARVVVGGDSAGGGMAACVAQAAADRGIALRLQLLVYPMLDDRTATKQADALVWTNRSNAYAWGAYLGHAPGEAEDRPYAVAARREHLAGLAPAWIGIGDIDLFHEESVAYAERLRAAGVACDLHVVPGMYHGAEHMRPEAPSMTDFVQRSIDAVGAAVAAG